MTASLGEELRALLAAARGWLREGLEEGLDVYAPRRDEASTRQRTFESQPRSAAGADSLGRRERPDRERPESAAAPAKGAAAPPPKPAAPASSATMQLRPTEGGPGQLALPAASGPWGEQPTLEAVRSELGDCRRCRLWEGRTQIVFGQGDPEADLLFVGEGPGEQEDLQGIPFCGRAGELLTRMIERGLGIRRSSVYICNVVKCRPPGNRTPLADEVSACRPFLDGQIDAVRPKVIVALGKPAAATLLGHDVAITRVRGLWHEYRGIPLMPTFHPAFLLRQYTTENRRRVWEDLKAALKRARELGGRFEPV